MINTIITGRIYHVVDKTTGEVIKVGSTTQTLKRRFAATDYKNKYTNHFLREVRTIESTDLDWYEPRNHICPFRWHLVAAETLEIVRMGTFCKTKMSNQASPLHQKLCGLGGKFCLGNFLGGRVSGNLAVKNKTGIHSPNFDRSIPGRINSPAQLAAKRANLIIARTFENQSKAGRVSGRNNIESGWIIKLGKTQGKRNADSGHCARISHLGASLGAITRNHNQYHIKRGIISPNCKLCKAAA